MIVRAGKVGKWESWKAGKWILSDVLCMCVNF